MTRLHLPILLACAALATSAGCGGGEGDDRRFLILTVGAAAGVGEITQLAVRLENQGTTAEFRAPEQEGARIDFPTTLAVALAKARQGTIAVRVAGRKGGVDVACGTADKALDGAREQHATVTLAAGPCPDGAGGAGAGGGGAGVGGGLGGFGGGGGGMGGGGAGVGGGLGGFGGGGGGMGGGGMGGGGMGGGGMGGGGMGGAGMGGMGGAGMGGAGMGGMGGMGGSVARPAFGQQGVAVFPGAVRYSGVLVMPNTAFVIAAGNSGSGNQTDLVLKRYTPAGVADTAFGGAPDGTVTYANEAGGVDDVTNLTLGPGPQGSIVVGGRSFLRPENRVGAAIWYFDAAGVLQTSFGDHGGLATWIPPGPGNPQPGRIGGTVTPIGSTVFISTHGESLSPGVLPSDTALVKLVNGVLDTTFGGGAVLWNGPDNVADESGGVALDMAGNVYQGGCAFSNATASRHRITRFTPQGARDTTFGVDGSFISSVSAFGTGQADCTYGLAVDGAGRVYGAGVDRGPTGSRLIVYRVKGDGMLDIAFGTGGFFAYPEQPGSTGAEAAQVVLARNGDALVVGRTVGQGDVDDRCLVVRLSDAGAPVRSFGQGGVFTSASTTSACAQLAERADGTLIVAGRSSGQAALYGLDAHGVLLP